MSFYVKQLAAMWTRLSDTIGTKYLFGTAAQKWDCYFNDRNLKLREENQQSARQRVEHVFSKHSTVEISGRDNAAERECFIRRKYDGNLRFV